MLMVIVAALTERSLEFGDSHFIYNILAILLDHL